MNQSEKQPEHLATTSTVKPVLFSLLILVSGIIIGASLTLITSGAFNKNQKLPPAPEFVSHQMVQQIVRELNLSPEQQEQIRPIITQHMKTIDDIRQEARPKINQEVKSMNEKILAVLDERQQHMWRNKMERMQDHFSRMRKARGQEGKHRQKKAPSESRPGGPGRQPRFRNQRPQPDQAPSRSPGYPTRRPPAESLPPQEPDGPIQPPQEP